MVLAAVEPGRVVLVDVVVVVDEVVVVYVGSSRLKYGFCSPYTSGSSTPSKTKTWSPAPSRPFIVGDSDNGMRMQPWDAGWSGTFNAPWMAMP